MIQPAGSVTAISQSTTWEKILLDSGLNVTVRRLPPPAKE